MTCPGSVSSPGPRSAPLRPPLVHLLLGAVASAYAWIVVITTVSHPGAIGINYNAPGTDYMVFHTAITLALQGDLSTLYDPDRFTALINRLFHGYLSADVEFRPWIYPPSFLLILLPFPWLGFVLSYGLFQFATGAAMLAALRACVARPAWWMALATVASPAASISVVSGQVSFLIVALLAAGALLLDRRSTLAGIAFGVLSFKPQFFLMVPVALLAGLRWRASAAAAATIVAVAGICAVLFGPEIWLGWINAFTRSTSDVDPRWFQFGRLWGESVYVCAYLLGASPRLAQSAQIAAVLLAGLAVCCAVRMPVALPSRLAVLLAATLLAAPHSGGYDLLLLVAATGLFLADRGCRCDSLDWMLALMIWLLPLVGVPALSVVARFSPVLTMVLLARILWCSGQTAGRVRRGGIRQSC
jgi:alpha-1,2-mannosyltransferase